MGGASRKQKSARGLLAIDIFNLVKILNPSVGRTRNIREIALGVLWNFSIFYVLSRRYFSYSLTIYASLSLIQFHRFNSENWKVDLPLSRPSVITGNIYRGRRTLGRQYPTTVARHPITKTNAKSLCKNLLLHSKIQIS